MTAAKTACAAALAVIASACVSSPLLDPPQACYTAQAAVARAKAELEHAEYVSATATLAPLFGEDPTADALDRCNQYPGFEHVMSQAHFVAFVAEGIRAVDRDVSYFLEVTSDITIRPSPSDGFRPQCTVSPCPGDVQPIKYFLQPPTARFASAENHLANVARDAGFSMVFDRLPIEILGRTIANIGGEYDLGEVYAARAVNSLLWGAAEGLNALHLWDELMKALYPNPSWLDYADSPEFRSRFALDSTDSPEQKLRAGMHIAAILFHNNPDLLKVQDVALLRSGAGHTGDGFGYLLKAMEAIRQDAETDTNQADDVIGYRTADGNETFILSYQPVCFAQICTMDIKPPVSIRFHVPPRTSAALLRMQDAFHRDGTGVVSWANDLVPLVAPALSAAYRAGIFNGYELLFVPDINCDPGPCQFDYGDANLIGGFLTELIPDVFRFNIKAYVYDNPALPGPRAWVPMWTEPLTAPVDATDDAGRFAAFAEINFVYEYECYAADGTTYVDPMTDGKIFCSRASDWPHFASDFWRAQFERPGFVATHAVSLPDLCPESAVPSGDVPCAYPADATSSPYGFRTDGLESPLPYFMFSDPSAGGLLELNFSMESSKMQELGEAYMDEWKPANQYSLNAFVALVASQIAGLLGG